jgi:hypothetical protein
MSLLSKTTLLSAVFCLTAAVIAAVSAPQSILSNWKPGNKAAIPKAEENPRYEAPLISCPESNQDPNQNYIVKLRQDHSMDQHDAAIGTLIEPYITRIIERYTQQVIYVARPIDIKLLECIRRDSGVEYVACNTYWWDIKE